METIKVCQHCGQLLGPKSVEGLCAGCLMQAGLGSGPQGTANPNPPRGFVPPEPAQLAGFFPQLDIQELIGLGGMGAVYKARQKNLERWVALKILPAGVLNEASSAERFTREARALARLSHPNIVTVYDFGQAGDFYYFLMEFIEGVNLRQLLADQKLAPKAALAIVPQICEALQYAHGQGVVHRDIKPENILLDATGRVKIADFGLAKLLGTNPDALRLTQPREVIGTPHYMAPEQVEHPQEVDHRADIFSLGVVFYELLTGELPLGKFVPPSQKVQIDVRLDEVVLRTLEKERDRRYQQAGQVKTDLDTIRTTSPADTSSPRAAAASASPPSPASVAASIAPVVVPALRRPALALMALGALNLLFVLNRLLSHHPSHQSGLVPLICVSGLLMISAGLCLRRATRYPLALAGGVAAILAGFIVGVPVGVWVLLLLGRPEIKAAFQGMTASETRATFPPVPTPLWLALFILSLLVFRSTASFDGAFPEMFISLHHTFLFVSAITAAVLMIGLVKLKKWAYWLAVILCLRRPVMLLASPSLPFNPLELFWGLLLLIPVLLSTKAFFPYWPLAPGLESWMGTVNRWLEGAWRSRWTRRCLAVPIGLLLGFLITLELAGYVPRAQENGARTYGYHSYQGLVGGWKVSHSPIWSFFPPAPPLVIEEPGQEPEALPPMTELPATEILLEAGSVTEPQAVTQAPRQTSAPRKYVRIVLDHDQMTFQGQATAWDKLEALLEAVPDRATTVLEWAVASSDTTLKEQNEWTGRCAELANRFGFQYASFIGIHALGTPGTNSRVEMETEPKSDRPKED